MAKTALERSTSAAARGVILHTGIGTGPLLGRVAQGLGYPLAAAFMVAAGASLLGGLLFLLLGPKIKGQGPVTVCKITPRAAALVLRSKAVFAIVMVGPSGSG